MRSLSPIKSGAVPSSPFDLARIREDFPILKQTVKGKPLIYLDNAATSQKPQVVIDALNRYYREENANIHRGVHHLSEKATDLFEQARVKIQHWINAKESKEILFVRGTTEAINLVAQSYGRKHLKMSDEIPSPRWSIIPTSFMADALPTELRRSGADVPGRAGRRGIEKLLTKKPNSPLTPCNALGTINR
jgi:cysteine desulfurase/selenocysteine lyase